MTQEWADEASSAGQGQRVDSRLGLQMVEPAIAGPSDPPRDAAKSAKWGCRGPRSKLAPTPVRDVSSVSPWLRLGVRPYLLAGDGLAFVLAVTLVPDGTVWSRLLLGAVSIALYQGKGLYRSRLTLSILDDLPSLVNRAAVSTALCAVAILVTTTREGLSPLLTTAFLFGGLVIAFRGALYAVVRRARVTNRVSHPTLLIGTGEIGMLLARRLSAHPQYGLRPVAFLDHSLAKPSDIPILPIVGDGSELAAAISKYRARNIIVAFPGLSDADLIDLVLRCDWLNCQVFVIPRLFELHHTNRFTDEVWGIPLVRMHRPATSSASWRIKRFMDILFAAIGIILCSPALALLAGLVRLEGGPGVLFRQERVGGFGRIFLLLKFRSMRPDTKAEDSVRWSIAKDTRVGPIGKILRATSLDELPQLWNVLRGDMSLVGPRPERPHFVSEFTKMHPQYLARLRVPAGMTGWAQIHGLRGDTSIEERVVFDNCYITNWSLWLDVTILARTIVEVFRRSGS